MSEIVPKTESVGQLFGLFGVTDDCSGDEEAESQIEEGEISEVNEIAINNENQCVICHSSQIKYRCPKCHLKTCSLDCCNRHKAKYNCDGIRDKFSFVKLSNFTQSEFLSDYFFLDDVDRTLDISSRERRAIISSKAVMPKWLQKLIREAKLRGTILRIMPAGFKRRKQNTTCFMYSQKTINWDIELKFVNAIDPKLTDELDSDKLSDNLVESQSEVCLIKHRVSENIKLAEVISELIELNDSMETKSKLLLYNKTGLEGISVLLRDESRTSKRQYFELDISKNIKDNLKHKTVIEFPTFLIVLNKFKHLYECFDDLPKEVKTQSDDK